jgi:hypothetical protein
LDARNHGETKRLKKARKMKTFWVLLGLLGSIFFGWCETSSASPPGGFFRGSGGFHGRVFSGVNGPAFRMGRGARRDFTFRQHRPFFRRGARRLLVQQFAWPAYWYPFYYSLGDPLDFSYLDYGSEPDYRVVSAGPVQPRNSAPAQTPVVVVINQGNAQPVDNSNLQQTTGSPSRFEPAAPARMIAPRSNERPETDREPATPDSAKPAAVEEARKPFPEGESARADKFVLVSWLKDGGKEVVFVQNTKSKEVEKVTEEPGINHLRLVEVHANPDPKQFEVIISDGNERLPVRFRF